MKSKALLLLGLLLLVTNSTDACGRCGIFGRGCRYAVAYHAPTYYAPAAVAYTPPAQTFVFNNSYPTPLLGNSVYGYSLAAQAYAPDPALILDRSSRLAELAFTSGQRAIGDFNDTAANALALSADASRRAQNTVLALSAIQANQQQPATANSQTLSFKATVTNGKLSVQPLELNATAQPAPAPCTNCEVPPAVPQPSDQGTLQFSAPAVGLAMCASCHDGTGRKHTPEGLVFDPQQAITPEQYQRAVKAVVSGKMPPKSTLSDDQKSAAIAELARLVQR
jgi:hypothetical protein